MFEQFAYFLLSGLVANHPQMSMFGAVIGLHKPQGECFHSHCECFLNQGRELPALQVFALIPAHVLPVNLG